ncbi:MAG TPA: hypothetical protein VGN26_02575 [Armatimonadota bacterium]
MAYRKAQGGGRISEAGQAALVGLVVAAALGLLLLWVLMGNRPKPKQAADDITNPTANTTYGQAKQRGQDVVCMNNLNQIRTAIRMAAQTGTEEGNPPSLQALSAQGITPSMELCPVSNRPYVYNPQTGQVACTTPGHQRF